MLHPEAVPCQPVRRFATIALFLIVVLAAIFAFSERAAAEVDAPGGVTGASMTGLGTQGAFSFTGTTGGTQTTVPNKAAPIPGAVASGASSLVIGTVNSTSYQNVAAGRLGADLVAGNLVMVIQSKGWANATLADQTPIDLYTGTVGQWEFARIQSVAGTTINFTTPLANSYPAGTSQIVSVPEYSTMTLGSTGTGTRLRVMSAPVWDGSSGGVMAFLATGAVTINGRGQVDATGDGMRGASADNSYTTIYYACSVTQYDGGNNGRRGEGIYSAGYGATEKGRGNKTNGGGGGNCHNAGGGGGGHGGQGGNAGYSWDNGTGGSEQGQNIVRGGIGGAKLAYSLFDRIAFGGGAGAGEGNNGVAGDGGSGGGAIFIRGASLASASGLISANGGAGETGTNGSAYDGSGGGGAGGSISLRFTGALACGTGVTATGGVGGSSYQQHGTGAGGGGGKIALQGTSVTCTPDVNNGIAGDNGTGYSGWGSGPTGSGDVTSSGASNAETATITAPTAAISTPLNGGITNNATPTISGTGTVGAEIRVTIDGVYVGSTTVAAGGAWSYVSAALTGGSHTVTVRPVRLGIWGTATSTNTFTVDLTAPTVNITAPTTPTNSTASKNVSFTTSDNVAVATVQCAVDAGAFATCTSPFATGTLSVGSHTIYVRATDTAGNVTTQSVPIVVDQTGPTVTIGTVTSPTASTASQSVTFTATDANGLATVQCRLNAGAYANCTSPYATGALTAGTNTVYVQATDNAGNVTTQTTTIVVDQTGPTVTITPPTSPTSSTASQNVAFTATDANGVSTIQCRVNSGTYANCTSPYATGTLPVGTNTVYVQATDSLGNVTTQTTTIVVDQTGPTVTLGTVTSPTASTASQNLTFTATDANGVASVQCRTNAGAYANCTSPYATGTLTVGSNTVYVQATDNAGNVTTQTRTIVVDQTGPTVTVTAPTPLTNSTASQGVTFTATDASGVATTQCRLNAGAYANCTSPYATGTLTVGSNTVYVQATDAVGNVTTQTATITVDQTGPTVSVTAPTPLTNSTAGQNVTFTTSDANGVATVQCRLNAGAYANCTSPFATGTLNLGTNTVYVQATDNAGNVTTQTATITVDQTGPTVTITPATSPTGSTASQNVAFTATDANGVATIQCRLNAAAYANCTSPFATGALTVGTNTVYVQATDNAGNVTTQTTTIVVDQTGPTVTITPATTPTNSTSSQNVAFTATDANGVATIQCRLNAAAYASCTSPFATGALTVGTNTVYVQATDNAGNVTTQTTTIVVDQTGPTVTITPATTPTNSTSSQNVAFTATDANGVATVQCRLNAAAYANCTSPFATGTLPVGTNTAYVQATDNAGNVTTQTTTIVVDQTGPTVTIGAGTTPTSSTASQSLTFTATDANGVASVQCRTNAGAYANCTSPYATGTLNVGTNTIDVRATDNAGNITTQTRTIVVDQTVPTVTITPATTPTNLTTSQNVAFTATDNVAIATLQCKVGAAGTYANCTSPYATGTLAVGSNVIYVQATDTAGNVTTQTTTIVVDQTGPTVTITPATTPTNSTASQNVAFTATDANGVATIQCRLNAAAYANCTSPFATGALTVGTNTVYVQATDNAGNVTTQTTTIVVDQTAPTVTITPPTTPTSSTASQNVAFTATDNVAVATRQCKVGAAGTYANCTSPYATGTLAAGSNVVYVQVTDTAGNVTTQTTTIVVDQTSPSVSITTPTTPTTSTASQNISFTASDNVALASVQCRTNSGSYANCTSPYATGALTVGTNTIYVQATDTAGNVTTQSVTIVVDQTAPIVTITPPTSPTNSTSSQNVAFTATDNVALTSVQCKVGAAGTYANCTSPYATGTLAAGNNVIYVQATDTAGNQTTQTVSIVVDQTAPTVTITPPTSPTNSTASQNVAFSASDNVALQSVQCKVGAAGTYANCTSPYATGTLAVGSNVIYVQATDTAGNVTTQTTTIVVDNSLPTVTITPPTSPTASTASQSIAFTATDNGTITTLQCKLNSAAYANCTSPFATGTLTVGTNTVYVRAVDNSGNETIQTATIVVDQTAPTVTITPPVSPTNSAASQNVAFTATDNVAVTSLQCKLGAAGTYANCTSPFATGALSVGTNTVYVQATDGAGNVSTQTVNIVVDQTGPTVTITPGTTPTNATTSQNVAFTATDANGVAAVQCRTNSGSYANCTSPYATGLLTAGTNTIYVQATDNAGNVTTQTTTIVVDTTPPTVSITPPTSPSNSTATRNVAFTASDNLALASVQCRTNAGAYANCTSPYATGTLTVGTNTIYVQATDTAGNVTTQTATIVVDTTSPSVSITAPSSPSNSTATRNITFTASDNLALASVQCRTNSGSYANCTSPYPTGTLTVGTNTIYVQATDTAGNVTTQSVTIVVDQTGPTVTITPATTPTNSTASQNVAFTATDANGVATIQCRLNAAAYANCTSPFATGTLPVGTNTVYVQATDNAGNVTTQTTTIVVDQTGPTVTITPATTPTNSTASQNVAFTATDANGVASVQCRLNSGSYATCTSPFATGTLTVGTNTVYVQATDTAGNVTTQTTTVVVDQTGPTVTITPATTPTNSTASQNVAFTATDANGVATLQCRTNSGAYANCTSPYATGTLPVGTNTIYVQATDNAGNVTTQSTTIVVDQTGPTVTITPATTPTNSTASQSVAFTATDANGVATLQCRLNAGAYANCTSPYATGTLAAGTNTVYVQATDSAGNVTTQTTSIVVDQTGPTVTITPATTPTNSMASQNVAFTATDANGVATLQCRLNAAAYANCSSPFATGALTVGTNTVYVQATDNAGNVTTQTTTIVVDQTGPTVTIGAATSPTNSTASQSITFTATDTNGIATVQCRLNSGSYANCTSPFATGTLPAGTNTVYVQATDNAGNVTTQTRTIVVDQTGPTVTITPATTPTNSTASQNVTFTATDTNGVSTLQCRLNSGSYANCTSPFATGTLPVGTNTVYVQATDSAGNVTTQTTAIVVDQTGPTVTIAAGTTPTNSTASQSLTFTATDANGVSTVQCRTNSGTYANCTSPYATGTLTAGTNTIYVQATDNAGNVTTQSRTLVVDLTAPVVTITPPTTPVNSTASQAVAFTATDDLALQSVQCKVGAASSYVNCTSPYATGTLAAGTSTVFVQATDTAGNVTTQTVNIVVDLTAPSAPTVTRTAPTSSPTSSTSATITYTPAEGGGTMQCSTDGSTWTTCAGSPVGLTGLTDGAKTYYVRQVDAAGNIGASASVNWVVDTAPPAAPTVVRTAPTSSPTSSTSATISYSGIEPGATAQCSTDGGTNWATCTGSPVNLSGLTDGNYSYSVRQIDAAGNTGSASTVTWTVDTAPPAAPSITRDAPTGSPSNSTSATISYSGIEPGATAQCSTDGTTWTTCAASPVTLSGLSDGPHTYYVRQLDEAGNPSTAVSTSWTVDATAPAAPTLNGPPAQTNNPNANFTFSGEPGATFQCKFGSGSYAPCTSPVEIPLASDGPYSFSVIQTDTAGNDSPPATVNFTLDTAGPGAPTIDTAPPALSDQDTATFSVTPAEPGGTLRCQIDSQPAATCTSPFTTPSLGDGPHTFTVWQVDAAGNPGDTESFSWTIDTTAPPAPSLSGPSGTVGFTTATIEISNTEPGVTFECNIDGAGWNACTDPLELTGLADGSHTVEVRASDAAGNTSSTSSITWTVDHNLFTVNVTGAPSGVVQSTSADLDFSASLPGSTYHCSVDGAAFAVCTSPLELDSLAEGGHTVEVYATNGAQTSPTVTRNWTVDTTGPGIAITAPGDDDTTGAAATLEFTSNDLNGPVTTTCSINGGTPFSCSSPESLTNLPAGEVTVTVVATDSAGNSASAAVTWNVDRTAPAVPAITSPSADTSTNDVRPTISGTAETNTTVKLYDNGALVATLTSNGSGAWTWTPSTDLSVGDHEYTATSVDAYGNESNESPSRTVTIDLTPPAAPVISTPNAGDTNDSTPTVTGTAEPNSTVTVYVDGSPVGTTTADGSGDWTLTISPALGDGDHTITADAEDAAGNTGPTSADRDITVDTALPSVAISSPTAGAKLNDTDVEVSFTAESGAIVECKVDTGDWDPCTSPLTIPGLGEGTHTVSVRATDAAGNAATAVVSFDVDRTAPNAPTINGPEGPTQDSTPTFSGNAEPGSSVVVTIGASTYGPVTADNDGHWSITVSPALADGDYTATAAATDAAGNASGASNALDFTVDTTAPGAPAIDSPTNAVDDPFVTGDPSPAISGNAGSAEAGATITIYVNGTAVGTATAAGDGSWTHTLQTPLGDGTYAVTARAEDEAGNQSPLSNTVNVRIDASNPTTTLTGNPGSRSNDSTPTFTFTADEPSTFECRVDGGAWAVCTNPHTTTALLDGEHTFEVRAKDASDNYSSPKSYTWTVDTQAPTITVTTSTVAPGVTPTFSIVSSEPGTTYTCKVDAAAAISCSTPFSPGTLPVGTHTLVITGTDTAGNTTQETVTFTVAAPPTNPGTPTTPTTPSGPSAPTAETCPGPDSEEVGTPAKLSLVAAKLSAGGSLVRFTTRADQFVLVRITLRNGSKKLGTVVIDSKANKNRNVPIKLKKKLPKNAQVKVRMSAVTMSGGKSVADATLITDKAGKKVIVSGASGKIGEEIKTVVNCGKESDGKKIKVAVKKISKVKVSLKKMTAEITASDWAIATVRVDQGGKKVGRKVIVLKPNKKGKAKLALGTSIGSVKLVKGKAVVTVSTFTADGVRQVKKLKLTVK